MSFTKQIVTIAAVGALTAATAVPAFALENEFHGLFKLRGIVSNVMDGNAGPIFSPQQAGGYLNLATRGANDPKANTYVDQRARILYQAKANDDLKLVTQFEIDSRWGDGSYNSNGNTRNFGGGIGADQVNLETKNVYLDFNVPKTPVNVKLGIQSFVDNYKGIIFSNDAAGAVAKAKLANGTLQFAWFRFDDAITSSPSYYLNSGTSATATTNTNSYFDQGSEGTTSATTSGSPNATLGDETRDLLNFGGKYSINKNLAVGADYYYLYSDVVKTVEATQIHTVGVNAETKVGPATLSGFAMYQFGHIGNDVSTPASKQDLTAFAANVAGRMKIGPGTARFTTLYLSGDSNPGNAGSDRNDFQIIMERNSKQGGASFLEAESQILLRSRGNTTTDRAVVYDLNNGGRGLITGFIGYDLPINKFYVNSNAGIAATAHNRVTVDTAGQGKIIGTELNTEIGYKMYDNLTVAVQGAYFFLGNFYHGAARNTGGEAVYPQDPFYTAMVFNYTF